MAHESRVDKATAKEKSKGNLNVYSTCMEDEIGDIDKAMKDIIIFIQVMAGLLALVLT